MHDDPTKMAFSWKSGKKQFDCTHTGMLRVRLALENVLDGPIDAQETYAWLVRQHSRPSRNKRRIRVFALRSNGGSLAPAECTLAERTIRGIVASPRRWKTLVREVLGAGATDAAISEYRAGLSAFADFCNYAAMHGGCHEGDGAPVQVPTFEASRAVPPFARDKELLSKVRAHCKLATALAKGEYGEKLSLSTSGLEALDRIAAKTAGPLDDAVPKGAPLRFALYALECMRKLHGGVWGRSGMQMPAVRLATGVIVTFDVVARFYAEPQARPYAYSMAAYAKLPLQL